MIKDINECRKEHKDEPISEALFKKCMDEKKETEASFFSFGGLLHDGLQLASDVYNTASSVGDISDGIDDISDGLETAGLIDAAGGGPEDPVGDVIAAVVGGAEIGYGIYETVKGTVDTVENVKKTYNDVKNDFSNGGNSENGNEQGDESNENFNGESEASFMSLDESKSDLFLNFVQEWLLI